LQKKGIDMFCGSSVTKWELDILNVRQEKTVEVTKAEQYDPDFPPAPIEEFLAWVKRMESRIPDEYRDTATFQFTSEPSYYDSHYAKVEVSYRRPETDEEWAARKADVARRQADDARREREQYEKMKAKFDK
jgi:hypothetical protein